MNNVKVLFLALIFYCVAIPSQVIANQALNPELLFGLKKGHKKTCVPTIARQLKSTGLKISQAKVELYCECLGNLYFNDLTKSEYAEMNINNGGLPRRVAAQRRMIQEYCVDIHFN